MGRAINRTLFRIGFALSLLLFAYLNGHQYRVPDYAWADDYFRFGFPLPLGETGGFGGHTTYFLSGAIANTAVCFAACLFAGWAIVRVAPFAVKVAVNVWGWHARTRL
jgi:hypothetical protein